MNQNFSTSMYNTFSWQPTEHMQRQEHSLPQPPFMPPNFHGNLIPGWNQPQMACSPAVDVNSVRNYYYPAPSNNQKYNGQKRRQNNSYVSFPNKKIKTKNTEFIDFCDVCDRGFNTEDKRKQHYEQHRKCSVAGCSFEAHFKIVEIHKRNVHGKNGICIQLNTPEEIQKWREMRRKNFPTAVRVQEKQTEEVKRTMSGGVLKSQSFGKKFNQHQGRRRNFFNKQHQATVSSSVDSELVNTEKDDSSSNDAVYKESVNPLDVMIATSAGDVEQASVTKPDSNDGVTTQSIAKPLSSLSQLMSNYASDESDLSGDDLSKTSPETCIQYISQQSDATVKEETIEVKNDCQSIGESTNSIESPNSTSFSVNRRGRKETNILPQKHKFSKNISNSSCTARLSRPSLLQMLLEPEIRQERNNILQCVRYIVNHNFFEKKSVPLC